MSWKKSLAIMGSLLAVLVIAGRRKPVDTQLLERKFSAHLDQYLAESEAVYPDIIPETEKKVFWADSAGQQTEYSIVYLHGFSATRQETAPLTNIVAQKLGANLFYTRLKGHGRPGDAMGEATANDWLNDADEAMEIGRRIGKKVIVVGTSTGGTLATWLATRDDVQDLEAVVLISPNYWVRAAGAGAMLWPWGKQILHLVQGASYEWEPFNELHKKYWTNKYPSVALVEMMRLLDYVNGQDFGEIKTPALFIYSPDDMVVDPNEVVAAYEQFGSETKVIKKILEPGDPNKHVLAGDALSPGNTDELAAMILSFVEDL